VEFCHQCGNEVDFLDEAQLKGDSFITCTFCEEEEKFKKERPESYFPEDWR